MTIFVYETSSQEYLQTFYVKAKGRQSEREKKYMNKNALKCKYFAEIAVL